MIKAAAVMLPALRLCASHDHACAKANDKPCRPSPSVTIVRKMLGSCDNRAGSAKRHGTVFPRHAEWPQVADAVIEAGNSNGLFHRPLASTLASARTPRAAPPPGKRTALERPGRAAAARGGKYAQHRVNPVFLSADTSGTRLLSRSLSNLLRPSAARERMPSPRQVFRTIATFSARLCQTAPAQYSTLYLIQALWDIP